MKKYGRIKYGLALFTMVCSLAVYAEDQVNSHNVTKIESDDSQQMIIEKAAQVLPTTNQLAYKQREFIGFLHFGPNTFTGLEWGDGMEHPSVFNPAGLDTDQWCRVMKSAGMKLVVLTAKHHDGFVLWQSRYTDHGVMSSPFQSGKGDVLKELVASCREYGLKIGVYLSPADLHQIESPQGLYGNGSRYSKRIIPTPVAGRPFSNKTAYEFEVDDYNEYFLNQLFELLTEYGPIHEVWFDGAHPKRKGNQQYVYSAWRQLIRDLAPEAVIFGREDVRWAGNESGNTRQSEWDVVPFEQHPGSMNHFSDMHGDIGSQEQLTGANYLAYLPAETNTSIREGWFYRDGATQQVRSPDDVFDIYERTVGGNSTFMLNVPPNRSGTFSDEDVRVLEDVGQRIRDTYSNDLLVGAFGPKEILGKNPETYIEATGGCGSYLIELSKPTRLNRFVVQEAIKTHGQRIERHALDAWIDNGWQEVASGTTVGYKKILRFPELTTEKLRLRIIDGRSDPAISMVSGHYYVPRPPQLKISRSLQGQVSIENAGNEFAWKPHGLDYRQLLGGTVEIRYTTDGSEPSEHSPLYSQPFFLAHGQIGARAFETGEKGSIARAEFGAIKSDWTAFTHSGDEEHSANNAIDGDVSTYWDSGNLGHGQTMTIDLGTARQLVGFVYTPPTQTKEGLIQDGHVRVSSDGVAWNEVQKFTFGNMINDPTPRTLRFKSVVQGRYIQIISDAAAGGSQNTAIAEIDFLVME